jgi:hypothetical protein
MGRVERRREVIADFISQADMVFEPPMPPAFFANSTWRRLHASIARRFDDDVRWRRIKPHSNS